MKGKIVGTLMALMFIMSITGASACTTSTGNFDDIPISVTGSWSRDKEAAICLFIHITNNSDKIIRDVQGLYFHYSFGSNGSVNDPLVIDGYSKGGSLFIFDSEGNRIRKKPMIKPGETITVIISKLSSPAIMHESFEVRVYITWIDFVSADNWGIKNFIGNETYEEPLEAPMVIIEQW